MPRFGVLAANLKNAGHELSLLVSVSLTECFRYLLSSFVTFFSHTNSYPYRSLELEFPRLRLARHRRVVNSRSCTELDFFLLASGAATGTVLVPPSAILNHPQPPSNGRPTLCSSDRHSCVAAPRLFTGVVTIV